MNKIDWVMQKKVGVFYITQEWKNKIYNYILENTYIKDINQAYINRNEADITFINGDKITFIYAYSGSILGRRFTQIIYEKGISDEIINSVIVPTVMPLRIEMGIDELEDEE